MMADCLDYQPDHNGECLNCDAWADAHPRCRHLQSAVTHRALVLGGRVAPACIPASRLGWTRIEDGAPVTCRRCRPRGGVSGRAAVLAARVARITRRT